MAMPKLSAENYVTQAETLLNQSIVSGLFRYPIKSCHGESLREAKLTSKGIKHDRELMLAFPEGRFISQRDKGCKWLAQVVPLFINDNLLRIEAPNMPELWVPIVRDGASVVASVHKKTGIETIDQGEDAAKWFNEFLDGIDCRLVAMAPNYSRQVDQQYALRQTDEVGFADGYPFLLTSEESLRDLNGRLPSEIPMARFRPNIVISGSGLAYGEDMLETFRIGNVVFEGVKPCARCVITTTDQDTGKRISDRENPMMGEPLATLSSFRNLEGRGAIFGQNLVNREKQGTIKLGDKISVSEIRPPLVFKA